MSNRKRNRKLLSKLLDDAPPGEITDEVKKTEVKDFKEFLKTEDPDLLKFTEENWELSDDSDVDENHDDGEEKMVIGEDASEGTSAETSNIDDAMSNSSDEAGSDFDDNVELADESDEEDDDEDDGAHSDNKKLVTKAKIDKWIRQLENGNYRGLLTVAQALYAALIAMDDTKVHGDQKKRKEEQKLANNMITTINLFPDICAVALNQVPTFLITKFNVQNQDAKSDSKTEVKDSKSASKAEVKAAKKAQVSKAGSIAQHPLWSKCRQGIKVLLKGYLLLMDRLVDSSAKSTLLKATRVLTIFFPASGQHKNLVKVAIKMWSSAEEETHRVQAFLIIHKMIRLRPDILDQTLRQMYLAYVSNTKFVNSSLLPNIYFMQKCLLELYKQDTNISYQHGFLYIRQLAIHLRKGLMNVSKDTLRSVANWQFVFALNIWCKIVTEVEGMEDLHLPLVQIVFGVFDLISGSPRLVPLTFHMIRCALMLCGPDQKYVPLWAPILELIKFLPTGKKAPRIEVLMESDVNKSSALPDFQMALKISGAQIKNKRLADAVLDEFYEVFITYSAAISHRVDFPELTRMPCKRLREFFKSSKNPSHRNCIKKLLGIIGENSTYIVSERSKARFTPKEKDKITEWQQRTFDAGTPLLAEIDQYKKQRAKERRQKLNGNGSLPTTESEPNFKQYLDTEEGKQAHADDREEYKTLFDHDSESEQESDKEQGSDNESEKDVEMEEEEPAPVKLSKRERNTLKKGAKDKIEEFSLEGF